MDITEVNVFLAGEEKLKAFVSLVFDGCFMVNDVKVIDGRNGLFVSMPSRRKKSGEFKDVAHPLNQATRDWMEDVVLSAYREALYEADRGDEGRSAHVCRFRSRHEGGGSLAVVEDRASEGAPSVAAAPAPSR